LIDHDVVGGSVEVGEQDSGELIGADLLVLILVVVAVAVSVVAIVFFFLKRHG